MDTKQPCLQAENEQLRAGYDAARLEIESLRERVQQLGQLARDVNSRRVTELDLEPVAAQSRFLTEKGWGTCTLEHHLYVKANPAEWPGYETRALYAAPQLAAQALDAIVDPAQEAHRHWDADRDAKVGKLLMTLSGYLPGYDKRADALHAAIAAQQGEGMSERLSEANTLINWFDEEDGFSRGTKAPHKWVLQAHSELIRLRDAALALALAAPPDAPVEAHQLHGDAKLAHDQCRAVVSLASSVAEVYAARAAIVEHDNSLADLIGYASAAAMEWLGDEMSAMDAATEEDEWIDPIFDAAQERWPQPSAALPDAREKLRTDVARAIWEVMREYEDSCDLALEDLGSSHQVWFCADAAIAARAAQGGAA